MLKKRLVLILGMVFLLSGLTGCSKNSVKMEMSKRLPKTGETWTVLMYMMGGNTSEEQIHDTLDELMSAEYSENVNIVLETGGREEWGMKGIYSDYLQRFLVQKGSLFLASQTAVSDMGSSNTLSDFLKWGINTYPAENYALVIWGCGAGALGGVGCDSLSGNNNLSIEDVYYSLSNTGKNFEFVGFDASCMSNLEMAVTLSPHAKYMIASEDIIMPCGFNYSVLANHLINNPDSTGADVGKVLCDAYYKDCKDLDCEEIATMAVTDLSKMSELTQAFDGMAGMMELAADNVEYCSNLMRRLQYVETLGAQSVNEGFSDMADLGNLAETIQSDMGATADEVIRVVSESVVYNVNGVLRPYVKGLGVYFPKSGEAGSIEKYCAVFPSHNHLTFARKVSVNADTVLGAGEEDYKTTPAYQAYCTLIQSLNLRAFTNDDGYYELNIDGDTRLLKEASIALYSSDKKSERTVYLGRLYNIDGTIDNALFTVKPPKRCLSIGGHNVMSERIEKGFDGSIYSVPVLLNGERAYIRIYASEKDNSAKLIGVWSGIDENGMDRRDMRKLKMGDKITPLFISANDATAVEGKSFRVGAFTKASWSGIDKDTVYEYCIEDMYGRLHGSGLTE